MCLCTYDIFSGKLITSLLANHMFGRQQHPNTVKGFIHTPNFSYPDFSSSFSATNAKKPELHCVKGWQNNLNTKLSSLHTDEETSDVDILVGVEKIPAHRTILRLNSDLLSAGEVSFNSTTQKTEIELLPEFSGIPGVVTAIIESFYTGKIDVNCENAKGVYKFGVCYSVSWLTEHTFPILKKMIAPHNFAELFDFAQNIQCQSLTSACLQKFDDELATAMSATKEWLEQDYYRVKLISLSQDVQISEAKMFQIVCNWLDHNPQERNSVALSLLSNVHYELIDHANLINNVYRWINEFEWVDDETRLSLFRVVSTATKKKKPGCPFNFYRYKLNSPDTVSSTGTTAGLFGN